MGVAETHSHVVPPNVGIVVLRVAVTRLWRGGGSTQTQGRVAVVGECIAMGIFFFFVCARSVSADPRVRRGPDHGPAGGQAGAESRPRDHPGGASQILAGGTRGVRRRTVLAGMGPSGHGWAPGHGCGAGEEQWHVSVSGEQALLGQVEGRTADDAAYWLAGISRVAVGDWVVAVDMCSIYCAVRRILRRAARRGLVPRRAPGREDDRRRARRVVRGRLGAAARPRRTACRKPAGAEPGAAVRRPVRQDISILQADPRGSRRPRSREGKTTTT